VPKASIIIPAYNAAPFIGETLNSIFEQTCTDFECIIVDDGSRDNTLEVVRSYTDKRISLIALPNSGGPAKPRNVALAAAKGEYVFMFDSDDIMYPTKLEESIRALDDRPNADILFTNYEGINTAGEMLDANRMATYESFLTLILEQLKESKVAILNSEVFYQALLRMNFIGTSSVVLRRSALGSSDIFNEELRNSDDRLFWTLFSKHHNALYLNSILHQYRILESGISNRSFTLRGPSKIKALEILLEDCNTARNKQIIRAQLSSDYATLAYEYKQKKDVSNQIKFSIQALKLGVNIFGIKLLLSGILFYIGTKFTRF
jgi:glycosyltransferase involved in cell wall biosynthesis